MKLTRCTGAILTLVLFSTIAAHILFNLKWAVVDLAKGTEFYDYESFKEFMEKEVPYTHFDQFGNRVQSIPKSEPQMELRIDNHTPDGVVVCEYIYRNNEIAAVRPSESDNGLPVTAISHAQYETAYCTKQLINSIFIGIYIVDLLCLMLVCAVKKKR